MNIIYYMNIIYVYVYSYVSGLFITKTHITTMRLIIFITILVKNNQYSSNIEHSRIIGSYCQIRTLADTLTVSGSNQWVASRLRPMLADIQVPDVMSAGCFARRVVGCCLGNGLVSAHAAPVTTVMNALYRCGEEGTRPPGATHNATVTSRDVVRRVENGWYGARA